MFLGRGLELVREFDKDVHFYTGLPSAAVFDRLLEYLNPDGRHSNLVYQATAKKWASDCVAGAEPGEAKIMERLRFTSWTTSWLKPGR